MTAFGVATPEPVSATHLNSAVVSLCWLSRRRRKAGVESSKPLNPAPRNVDAALPLPSINQVCVVAARVYRRAAGRVRLCPGIQICDDLYFVYLQRRNQRC
jgi:hypothetical protein